MRDVYAWIDPLEEQQRADRAEADLRAVSAGFGRRLIDVWDSMARYIVKEVAKPYAQEHGDQAIRAISDEIEISSSFDILHDHLTFQAATINPIRVMYRVNDYGRSVA